MKLEPIASPLDLGRLVKRRRQQLGLTQADLALASGTGVRFISDLENGKATCQSGRSLQVLAALGLRLSIHLPDSP